MYDSNRPIAFFFSFGTTLPRPKAPRHERIEAFMTFIIKTFHSKPAFMKKEYLADADSVGTQNTFSFCIWACAKSLSNSAGGRSLTTLTKFCPLLTTYPIPIDIREEIFLLFKEKSA